MIIKEHNFFLIHYIYVFCFIDQLMKKSQEEEVDEWSILQDSKCESISSESLRSVSPDNESLSDVNNIFDNGDIEQGKTDFDRNSPSELIYY